MNTAIADKKNQKEMRIRRIKRCIPLYIMIAPSLIITLIFAYLPLPGLLISFMDYDIFKGILGSEWVGLRNIKTLFEMPNMIESVVNTLFISVLSIVIVFPVTILLAVLLNEVRQNWFKRTVQTISYLPHFLSWISVIGIASTFYAINGPLNDILNGIFGMERTMFLASRPFFVPNVLILTIWKETGWSSIIFLAAITGIDVQLYESAAIDGAGRFRQFLNVTIPGILPTIIVMLILKIGAVFGSNFDLIYGLQNVYIEFDVISTIVYKYGIQQGDFGISTALSFCQGMIALILTLSTNKLSERINHVSIW